MTDDIGELLMFWVMPISVIITITSLLLKGLLGLIKPMKVRKIEDKIFKISNAKYRAIGLLSVIISILLIFFAVSWYGAVSWCSPYNKRFTFILTTATYYVLAGSSFMLIKGLLSLFIPLKTRRWMKDLLYTSDTKIRMYHLTITVMGLALIGVYVQFRLVLITIERIVEGFFDALMKK